jgi:hypothetical protein
MNGRAVAIQGGLALVGLTAAYLTWQRRPELQAGEAFVLDITKNELQQVRFDDDSMKSWVELQLAGDDNGSFVMVRVPARTLDAKGTPPDQAKPAPERLLRGNDAAKTLYERFAPLRATRALGVLDAAKLKDLRLDEPKRHLTVQTRAGRRVFDLATPPTGGNDPYLRDKADGRVFVIARPILTDFSTAATSLIERRLHNFRLEEVDRVLLAAGAAKKNWRLARTADGQGVEFALTATPDKPDPTARAWHERAFNLGMAEILGKGEKPAEGDPQSKLRLEYFARGRSLGWIELAEVSTTPAAPMSAAASPAKSTWYARSEFTVGWVKLAGDQESLVTEGVKLAGGRL